MYAILLRGFRFDEANYAGRQSQNAPEWSEPVCQGRLRPVLPAEPFRNRRARYRCILQPRPGNGPARTVPREGWLYLVRCVGKADSGYRRNNDLCIENHRPMVRIIAVEDDAPLEGRCATAADLPETGDTRPA